MPFGAPEGFHTVGYEVWKWSDLEVPPLWQIAWLQIPVKLLGSKEAESSKNGEPAVNITGVSPTILEIQGLNRRANYAIQAPLQIPTQPQPLHNRNLRILVMMISRIVRNARAKTAKMTPVWWPRLRR